MFSFGHWLLAHYYRPAAIALGFIILPVLFSPLLQLSSVVVSVIVAFVTLSKGAKQGVALLAWLILPMVAMLYLHRISFEYLLFVRCVAVWALASLLRGFSSWRLLLEASLAIGVIIVLVVHWVYPDIAQFWSAKFQIMINEVNPSVNTNELKLFFDMIAPYWTGLYLYTLLILAFLELMLARCWQSMLFRPGAFSTELINIRSSYFFMLALLLLFVLGEVFKIRVALDSLPIFFFPFVVIGLSVFHGYLVKRFKDNIPMYYVCYLVCVIFMSVAILLLTMIGLVNSIIHCCEQLVAKIIKKNN